MDNKLKLLIKLNGLQYNVVRDPQVYRRCVKEPFRIQVLIGGAGTAQCTLNDASGGKIAAQTLDLPGTFAHDIAFDTAGTRIVTLKVESAGRSAASDLRLDVLEHAWVG